jgi:hypothetical protein
MGLFSKKTKNVNSLARLAPVSTGSSIVLPQNPANGTVTNISSSGAAGVPSKNGAGGGSAGCITTGTFVVSGINNIAIGHHAGYQYQLNRENSIALEYLHLQVHKIYKHKSVEFRQKILSMFENKSMEELQNAIHNLFSTNGVDFLNEMADEEIINYLKITV